MNPSASLTPLQDVRAIRRHGILRPKAGQGLPFQMHRASWFTLGRGAISEVFYPRADDIALRDSFLIVTGPDGFFSDERWNTESSTSYLAIDGIPAFRIENRCVLGRYQAHQASHYRSLSRCVAAADSVRAMAKRGGEISALCSSFPAFGESGVRQFGMARFLSRTSDAPCPRWIALLCARPPPRVGCGARLDMSECRTHGRTCTDTAASPELSIEPTTGMPPLPAKLIWFDASAILTWPFHSTTRPRERR